MLQKERGSAKVTTCLLGPEGKKNMVLGLIRLFGENIFLRLFSSLSAVVLTHLLLINKYFSEKNFIPV